MGAGLRTSKEMSIKESIQNHIHNRHLKKYQDLLARQKDSYRTYLENWNKKVEKLYEDETAGSSFCLIKMQECTKDIKLDTISQPYIIFYNEDGIIDKKAYKALLMYFYEHKDINLLYSHEDQVSGKSDDKSKVEVSYSNPWFKAEYSPNTLLSFMYMGSLLAVRTEALKDIQLLKTGNYLKNIYDMILKLTDSSKAGLVDLVLYHGYKPWDQVYYSTAGKDYFDIKDSTLIRRGIRAHMEADKYGYGHMMADSIPDNSQVSIIIPSKDHPDVLKRCVESIKKLSSYTNYEIILIDNGSNINNRTLYESLAMHYGFTYIYEEMDFNFSKMCNIGASKAKGSYLLFLNDDMEVISPDWLERMLSAAALPQAGAIGAKLLYPDSSLIQHAGITNMYEGPAHKLLREDDSMVYYAGHNRFDYDMIGVTAACLLVKKDIFEEIEHFDENFKVAYNDVDLCFKIDKKGYHNILRNDVILYHHESLSRGDDNMDQAKKARLKAEGDALYDKHPDYYDYDPYYSKHLTGVSGEYNCSLPYENRNVEPVSKLKRLSMKYPEVEINETLIIGVDHAMFEKHGYKGMEPCYLVDLHAHVRNLDSADYTYRMILKSDKKCYEVPCTRRFRPDVEKILNNQTHVELSGFVARIPVRLLPKGQYDIYIEARSIYSRQVLVNKAKIYLDCNN